MLERWIQVDLLSFVIYRAYKLIEGCLWETDKVASLANGLREEVGLYEMSCTDCSVHLITVPIFLRLQYKPSLTKLERGNDDPHVSCHQPEVP